MTAWTDKHRDLYLTELAELAEEFDTGMARMGTETDEPEGSRYITMSDTCAKQIAEKLRTVAIGLRPLNWKVPAEEE